jgi:hypothetical protein
MPIHIDFFHPNRLAIIVARGEVTMTDVGEAARTMLESNALHYRKLVDVSSPSTPMKDESLEKLAAFMRNAPNAATRGPLAIIVGDDDKAGRAEQFASLTATERPIKVFKSLHEARRWLEEQPLGKP